MYIMLSNVNVLFCFSCIFNYLEGNKYKSNKKNREGVFGGCRMFHINSRSSQNVLENEGSRVLEMH